MADILLEVRGLSKSFGGNKALDDVSLTVRRGEIVALLGHNGSGKSTLVKVLSGNHTSDRGDIILDHEGRRTSLHFIHQNLGLVPTLTVIENLDLGIAPAAGGLLPFRHGREKRRVEKLIEAFGVRIDVDVPVGRLTPAEQTIVAIVRAFDGWSDGDDVLVLDEPTAALHGEEIEVLQRTVRKVAATGAGIIYISHRLGEVVELADRAVVLKDGRVVAETFRGQFTQADLVRIIAGGELPGKAARRAAEPGAVRFEVRDLHGPSLHGIDLTVRAGEIVGISGLLGSGVEQLNSALFGASATSGTISVDGVVVPQGLPAVAISRGLAYVPADRRMRGSITQFTAAENLTLPRLSTLCNSWGAIDIGRERAEVDDWMSRARVVPMNSAAKRFDLFSGGNQQKILLAKWLRLEPRVLLLDEPTQGVDAGAQAEIYELLAQAARKGASIVVCSSDTKELAAISDRVLVMREGCIVDEFGRESLSESALVRAVVAAGSAAPAARRESSRP